MSSFKLWPLYTPGKHTPTPTAQYLDMPHSWSAGFGEENIHVPLLRIMGEKGSVFFTGEDFPLPLRWYFLGVTSIVLFSSYLGFSPRACSSCSVKLIPLLPLFSVHSKFRPDVNKTACLTNNSIVS